LVKEGVALEEYDDGIYCKHPIDGDDWKNDKQQDDEE